MNTNSSEAFNLSLELSLAVSRSAGPSRAQQAARLSGAEPVQNEPDAGLPLILAVVFTFASLCGVVLIVQTRCTRERSLSIRKGRWKRVERRRAPENQRVVMAPSQKKKKKVGGR